MSFFVKINGEQGKVKTKLINEKIYTLITSFFPLKIKKKKLKQKKEINNKYKIPLKIWFENL